MWSATVQTVLIAVVAGFLYSMANKSCYFKGSVITGLFSLIVAHLLNPLLEKQDFLYYTLVPLVSVVLMILTNIVLGKKENYHSSDSSDSFDSSESLDPDQKLDFADEPIQPPPKDILRPRFKTEFDTTPPEVEEMIKKVPVEVDYDSDEEQ